MAVIMNLDVICLERNALEKIVIGRYDMIFLVCFRLHFIYVTFELSPESLA